MRFRKLRKIAMHQPAVHENPSIEGADLLLIDDSMARKSYSRRSINKGQNVVVSSPAPSARDKKNHSIISCGDFKHKMLVWSAMLGLILLLGFLVCFSQTNSAGASFYTAQVLQVFPHDPAAFTQGLQYAGDDNFYESTGLYGQSSAREVRIKDGMVQKLHKMNPNDFGEGLTLLNERLYQVTWKTNLGYVYDRHNLSQVRTFHHPMKDGWGLATDGKNLFGSDGSSTLYYFDPVAFKEQYKVKVKYEGFEINNLNELEFINGEVWANVWQSDCIVRISPKDGSVLGWILLHDLRMKLIHAGYNSIDVLNGIAWDKEKERLFVTGKLWPELYQIKLQPLSQQQAQSLGNISQVCQLT